MANPDFAYCVCPVCRYPKAAVRVAVNGKAYVNCDECVSSVRTLSGIGDKAIRAMITSHVEQPGAPAAPAAAAPKAEPATEKKPEKKRGAFADALDVLAGGGR